MRPLPLPTALHHPCIQSTLTFLSSASAMLSWTPQTDPSAVPHRPDEKWSCIPYEVDKKNACSNSTRNLQFSSALILIRN